MRHESSGARVPQSEAILPEKSAFAIAPFSAGLLARKVDPVRIRRFCMIRKIGIIASDPLGRDTDMATTGRHCLDVART